MENTRFSAAVPVFPENCSDEKNIHIGLYCFAEKKAVGNDGILTLRVASSCFYRVFVDGRFVFYGPARASHGFFRVDELPIKLEKDSHVALEFIYRNVNSFDAALEKGFFCAEAVCGDRIIAATGKNGFEAVRLTERVQKVQRYSFQRPFCEAYRLREGYEAWRIGEKCQNAVPVSLENTPEKNFVPRRIPYNTFPTDLPVIREAYGNFVVSDDFVGRRYADRSLVNAGTELLGGYAQNELEWTLSDDYGHFDFSDITTDGKDFSGVVSLKKNTFEVLSLKGEKTGFISFDFETDGGSLYFAYEEIKSDNGDIDALRVDCCNLLRIDAEKGRYSFISAEPKGFKYMKFVSADGSFTIRNIKIHEYVCPVPINNSYKGRDKTLAMIYDAAVQSFLQCSSDIFMDCPTRERAGWLCDSFFLGRSEYELTGKNLIERNYLENFLLPEGFPNIKDGMFPMCYPADHNDKVFIPNWAMWFVLELKEHCERTHDREFMEAFRNKVYRLLEWFGKYENRDGLLVNLPSWVFVEWSEANNLVQDLNFPSNMLYSKVLSDAAIMYGDASLMEKSEKLKETVRKLSFNGEFFVDNYVFNKDHVLESSGKCTETCQYYAFFTRVATKEEYPELWEKLITDFGPGRKKTGKYPQIYPSNAFIGNYLRLILLDGAGLFDKLIDETRDYLAYMARRTGTLWENDTERASCNHGFSSYAAYFIRRIEENRK